ncbi:MAG TPA: hypothetical protein VFG21_09205 [Xanthomonadaceae bacterium]|nr:hypothetical protein [Xanthomonadaceae bacterium]
MTCNWFVPILALLLAGQVAGADGVQITEHTVPWPDTRPRDPYVAPDGRVWFVGQTGNYLAVFDPRSEHFERFALPQGTRPHTVVVGADGIAWVAGNGNGTLVRYDPATAEFATFALPEQPELFRKDPHTLAFDDDGDLWFTLQQGNAIGHFDTETHAFRILPLSRPNTLPYGIVAEASGRPWVALLGTHALATVVDADRVETIELPRESARPRRIGVGTDGGIWFVDYADGYLGRLDPSTGQVREWRAPSGDSGPYAMGVDTAGRIWFFETSVSPNRLVGFDPESGEYRWQVEVPSGGGSVRHMSYDRGRDGFWFGTDTNNLGFFPVPH